MRPDAMAKLKDTWIEHGLEVGVCFSRRRSTTKSIESIHREFPGSILFYRDATFTILHILEMYNTRDFGTCAWYAAEWVTYYEDQPLDMVAVLVVNPWECASIQSACSTS